MEAASHLYLIALGSNQPHRTLGPPAAILRHAVDALELPDIDVFSVSSIIRSRPIGPSRREYANAAALILSPLLPPELLTRLQMIERHFGRNDVGQKWQRRPLDLDIILWDGGLWADADVCVPHPLFRNRDFVLGPAAQIAPEMRDPITHLTIKQLRFRFLHGKRVDPGSKRA